MFSSREVLPYDLTGRWYRFFVESNGAITTITDGDLEVDEENSYMIFPENFHIHDRIYDVHSVAGASAIQNLAIDMRIYKDGRQGIQIPSPSCFDYAYIYVFGHFD